MMGRESGQGFTSHCSAKLEGDGFHTAIAGISLRNKDSVRLHEKFGFEKVAHFREVGRKFDRWFDVGYWQKILSK